MSIESSENSKLSKNSYASSDLVDTMNITEKYSLPTVKDNQYIYKLSRFLGLKIADLENVYNPFLMNTYLRASVNGKTTRRINVHSYLNLKVSPDVPPNSLIKANKWAELARKFPNFTSGQLLEYIINIPPKEQAAVFHLFDPEYYKFVYSTNMGQRQPIEFFLSEGIFLGHETNPFLITGQFWKGWLRENIRLEGAANAIQLADQWKHLGAKIQGIWPGYGSRHDAGNVNPFQVLDDYLGSAAYSTWRYIFHTDPQFDLGFYRATQEDLRDLSDEDAEIHFREYGSKEGRASSMLALLKDRQCAFNALESDFDWEAYRYSNADLAHLDSQTWCIAHFVCFGHREARMLSPIVPVYDLEKYKNFSAFSSKASVAVSKTKLECSVRLYFHVFYEALVPEYIRILRAAHLNGATIYVNSACGVLQPETISLLAEFNPVYIVSPNRGRDIGGYYYISKLHPPADSDIVALVHTKKSPHVSAQYRRKWVANLVHAIGNDKGRFRQNVDAMCMDPTLMLIGSVYQLFVDNGGANKSKLVQLLNRIGLDNSNMLFPFVAGTMAIYRGAVLNRLFEVVTPTDLDEGRPDDLTYNVDGQFAHALERALGILGHKLGRVVWR